MSDKLTSEQYQDRLIEKVANAIMAEAKLLNDPKIQQDFDPGFIDSTRIWARKYARAAVVAYADFICQDVDAISDMVLAYERASGEAASRYGMAAARNTILATHPISQTPKE